MWAEGSIKIENSIFHYWVKHYEEPSEDYGIDGGRISKLMLKRNGEIAYNYDRGPDIEPVDEETEMALVILMKEYRRTTLKGVFLVIRYLLMMVVPIR